jgi:hypothetical protein
MQLLKRLFGFYIQASIHVALAVLALLLVTNLMFYIPFDNAIAGFVFFGTVFGYNFIKYEVFFRQKLQFRKALTPILTLSLFAFLVCGYFFFQLKFKTQVAALVFFGLTFLYTVPLFSTQTNMRNWSGIKIYVVAFCWSGVTILLPVINFGMEIYKDIYIKFCQRFLLVIVLILIFEIIDLKKDDPDLLTVPQKIGISKTKALGYLLLISFYILEFFKSNVEHVQLLVNFILVVITTLFLHFSNENRNRYYTAFWVESIPVLWLALIIGFRQLF